MPSAADTKHFTYGTAQVTVFPSAAEMANAAAERAAALIAKAVAERGRARIMLATGNSQLEFVKALVARRDIDWGKVEAFHMDEYVDIDPNHPASFRRWLRTRFEARVRSAKMHYIDGDAADSQQEIARYTGLLAAGPIDLAFVGFGENGHIAFNDPAVADFADPAMLKLVTLDEASRKQQVGEGHFPSLDAVPRQAITVTCSGLFRAAAWVCCVPEKRKAQAVQRALEGPIAEACPASLVRRHADTYVFLDEESAMFLGNAPVAPS